MKKCMILLLCCMLLVCSAAMAEPRYPVQNTPVTDSAAVLSQETVEELSDYHQRLEKATDIRLHVVTVDFLDGWGMDQYLQGLWQQWQLEDDDLLVLLAVGEDKFAARTGADVARKLGDSLQQKLLSAYLEQPFLHRDYDGAIRAYIPALTQEINKAYRTQVTLDGLFGTEKAPAQDWAQWAEDWTARLTESHAKEEPERSARQRMTDEDDDTGFSLGKVLLTLFLLSVIFGKKARRGRFGCGCSPFSSILAALGIFKLWKKD